MKQPPCYKFLLYVAGDTQNSALALANLRKLCKEYLPGRHEIEVVDAFKHPKRMLEDGILMTPTLVRILPVPTRRIIGTLSHADAVLNALEIDPAIEK